MQEQRLAQVQISQSINYNQSIQSVKGLGASVPSNLHFVLSWQAGMYSPRCARKLHRSGEQAGAHPEEPGELPGEQAPAVPSLLLLVQR